MSGDPLTNGAAHRGARRVPVGKPRPPRTAPTTAPQARDASFAEQFRLHAMPALITKCRAYSVLLALDAIAFERAYRTVMQAAIRRGALRLPPIIFEDLDEWTATCLIETAASLDVEVAAARQRAEDVARQCRVCAALAAVPPCAP